MHADIGIGLIVAWMVCAILKIKATWLHALAGVAFALLMDSDAVYEWWMTGQVGAHASNPYNHRDLLHLPLPYLLVGMALVYLFFGRSYAWIFLGASSLHFAHDSFGIGWGIKWLWPFSGKNYKFFCEKDNTASWNFLVSWTPSELKKAIIAHGDPTWFSKYLWSPLFWIETIPLVIGVILWTFFKTALRK